MQEVIQILCEIDHSASRILDSVNDEKDKLSARYDERFLSDIAAIEAQTQKRLDGLKGELEQKIQSQIEKLQDEARQDLQKLDEDFREHHDKYVECIFRQITGE